MISVKIIEICFECFVDFIPSELSKTFKDGDHVRIIQPSSEYDQYTVLLLNVDPETSLVTLHFDNIAGLSVTFGF